MSKQAAIRLPDETYARLQLLATNTGRTATFYIREAIEAHLEDLEDAYLADQVLGRIQRGEESALTAEELWRELGD
jgi:RHH-type rel operon transcriptional repressor/antitoxin RelB